MMWTERYSFIAVWTLIGQLQQFEVCYFCVTAVITDLCWLDHLLLPVVVIKDKNCREKALEVKCKTCWPCGLSAPYTEAVQEKKTVNKQNKGAIENRRSALHPSPCFYDIFKRRPSFPTFPFNSSRVLQQDFWKHFIVNEWMNEYIYFYWP